MAQATIEAQPRTALGKKVKALRRAGITPIHVYGRGDSVSLQANTYELVRTILDVGYTTPITVKVGNDEHFVMINKVQLHPFHDLLLHVDMLRISRTEKLQAAIPLQLEGEAIGAREEGAELIQDAYTVDVEALPTELPNSITVDIAPLTEIGASITAGDLPIPPNVTLVTDPETVIARVVQRTTAAEEEEAVEEEAAEAAEGEEAEAAPEESEVTTDGDSEESGS